MAELTTILAGENIPRRSGIDDVGSVAAPVVIADIDGYVEYVNAGGGYEDGNGVFWNRSTNTLDCSSLPLYAKIDLVLRSTINVSDVNAIVTVKFECPRPAGSGGPVVLDEIDIDPVKKSTDYRERALFHGYNGALVKQYGVKAYTKVSAGNVTISNRTLLARV